MVKAWKEKVVIPTYEIGKAEKNPIFLEKRVYQGSSGVVYPYPVVESVSDERTDKEYNAVFLENDYLKIMILPELGGRVQMAYDKIAQRHFIYYNHVIKPALVGLAGPWISGGIEFNWPQHHRPSTFMPVDCSIISNSDGSVTVWVNEIERMFHQKGTAGFTLRPGKAYLEIDGKVCNPTDLPQTFLWWANPAVAVNDHYRSVFPPDINAVFDHGKRDVSTFPIATGTYYKMDYSAGVDISNYKNIKVPTSYMGVNSKYDFEGGYENDTQGGMLHVASHHFSPGKKQWTWGNGDFGRAWDRNLTDEDGPYIELMAGVFTENQPDFSWLMPGEEKSFTQYFMPYREIGIVKNATKDILLNMEREGDSKVRVKIFATSSQKINIYLKDELKNEVLADISKTVSPEDVTCLDIDTNESEFGDLKIIIERDGHRILEWQSEENDLKEIPDAAEPAALPNDIKTNEQLYLTGLHLEQYRHATFSPVDYYEEALRRDPDDVRCNNAMGLWYIRKGRFNLAEKFLRRAVSQLKRKNPNPYDGEPIYNLGLCMKYQERLDEAYSLFLKATWNGAWQEAGFLEASKISGRQHRWDDALYEIERCLIRNTHNHKALAIKSALLMRDKREEEALSVISEAQRIDPFNFGCLFIRALITRNDEDMKVFVDMMRGNAHNYDETALIFSEAGLYSEALMLWNISRECRCSTPMTFYYSGWTSFQLGDEDKAKEYFSLGAAHASDYCFPNSLEAVLALQCAISLCPYDGMARYYLANLFYDKRQYDLALHLWESAEPLISEFPTLHRNLALSYFNKFGREIEAVAHMERAFELDPTDSRILMELDQLYKRLQYPHSTRLAILDSNSGILDERYDLVLEKITLLNQVGQYEKAMEILDSHRFHPWEGGEGKVPAQYQYSRTELAKEALSAGHPNAAIALLEECLVYPEHLGEGKLECAQDNDFNYLLGVVYDAIGDKAKSMSCLINATVGENEPAPAIYYNDAKPEKIFYAGLAWRKLGNEDMARSLFHRLINYGKRHYHDEVKLDYFAVSLPDLLIWEDDLAKKNIIHCLYMMALGYAGLGDMRRFEKYISQAAAMDINHQGIMSTLSFVRGGFME